MLAFEPYSVFVFDVYGRHRVGSQPSKVEAKRHETALRVDEEQGRQGSFSAQTWNTEER
jgi:hypothetical protein